MRFHPQVPDQMLVEPAAGYRLQFKLEVLVMLDRLIWRVGRSSPGHQLGKEFSS
jgi:hypothetical protein